MTILKLTFSTRYMSCKAFYN